MKGRVIILWVLLFVGCGLDAQIRLPQLISNGMVLQRGIDLKIWGWASPHEPITVSFVEQNYYAVADAEGNWAVMVPKQKAGGPYTMKVSGSNEIVVSDILIGDVWVCSGQSNMEQGMNGRLKYRYAAIIASASNMYIRQFLVPDKCNFNGPQKDVDKTGWESLSTQTIGNFTAVGYFFANELYKKNKTPIGLINAALGGAPAESWLSEAALKKFPAYWNEMQQYKDSAYVAQIEEKNRIGTTTWNKELNRMDEGIKGNWRNEQLEDTGWQATEIPTDWLTTASGFVGSVAWFRRNIVVPPSMAGKTAKLELGRIADADSVFINGHFVGNTTYQFPPRRYELGNTILKEGINTIVVRVVSNGGSALFLADKRYELTSTTDTVSLSGKWQYKLGAKAPRPAPETVFVRWKPGGLYNAMIAPLTNYAIKGIIWYQGESNANRPDDYGALMQTLIQNWRHQWGQGNIPFLFVQLPNYMEAQPVPQQNSTWAKLRQQQLQTLVLPNTGMAVAIDLGEWNDIHPENKKDVGYRLFLLAQKLAYGNKQIVASGPLFQSMKREDNKLILSFTNTGSGLVVNNQGAVPAVCNELQHFAIAGADGHYVKAKALINNKKVIVWNEQVPHPVAVKYAWADNPANINFYNKEGLPAAPFEAQLK